MVSGNRFRHAIHLFSSKRSSSPKEETTALHCWVCCGLPSPWPPCPHRKSRHSAPETVGGGENRSLHLERPDVIFMLFQWDKNLVLFSRRAASHPRQQGDLNGPRCTRVGVASKSRFHAQLLPPPLLQPPEPSSGHTCPEHPPSSALRRLRPLPTPAPAHADTAHCSEAGQRGVPSTLW